MSEVNTLKIQHLNLSFGYTEKVFHLKNEAKQKRRVWVSSSMHTNYKEMGFRLIVVLK